MRLLVGACDPRLCSPGHDCFDYLLLVASLAVLVIRLHRLGLVVMGKEEEEEEEEKEKKKKEKKKKKKKKRKRRG